jgi:Glycosyl hydrolase family 59
MSVIGVRMTGFRLAVCAAVLGVLAGTIPAAAAATSALHSTALHSTALHNTVITLDGTKPGPAFQGVGAVSGGGGNSRLLIDYPPTQQQEILDYLFKPGYGASLQILKLEIGGDAFATDGAEPSIEHTKGQINCNSGYEFWLAEQARALNPNIALYGLQWNAPGWVGGGHQDAWTTADIGYIVDWLNCAKTDGLAINYIGGWDEHLPHGITPTVVNWFVKLRATLNADGYSAVQIVGIDSYAHRGTTADVSDLFAKHPEFKQAISVIGYHNLCHFPLITDNCYVPPAAVASGKPIWESEFGSLYQGSGIGAMARSLDNAYIWADATGLIMWPLMTSMPAELALEGRGLVVANQPWSGHFTVSELAWVIAQTTQFTQPGWLHLAGANKVMTDGYGSYNSYEAPDSSAWSLVAQTSTATKAQTITVNITGGLPSSTVYVWSTKLYSTHSSDWMASHADLSPSGSSFSYTLQPGYVYTFTTVSGGGKGAGTSPAAKPMRVSYTSSKDLSDEPKYLAPQSGAFEYLPGSSTTFAQEAIGRPVFWQTVKPCPFAYAVLGSSNWLNYTVSDSVNFVGTTHSAGLIARFSHGRVGSGAERFNGYVFVVSQSGAWRLFRDSELYGETTLDTGQVRAFGVHAWVPMSLSVDGSTIIARIKGVVVASVTDSTYGSGDAGISTGSWYKDEFKDLKVTS